MGLSEFALGLYQKYGAKTGVFEGIKELGLDIPLKPYVIKRYDQSLDEVMDDVEKLNFPLIARGSHRNDFYGLTGVLGTEKNIKSKASLTRAIAKIEAEARSRNKQRFVRAMRDGLLDHEVHLIIQEQYSFGYNIGSALRLPNREIFANYWEFGEYNPGKSEMLRVRAGPPYSPLHEKLRQMFEILEASPLSDSDYLHQMEFAFENTYSDIVWFSQWRAPLAKTPVALFDIEQKEGSLYFQPDEAIVFGTTPYEGLELPAARLSSHSSGGLRIFDVKTHNWAPEYDNYLAYCLQIMGLTDYELHPDFGKISAFASLGESGLGFLAHDFFRFVKSTQVSVISLKYAKERELLNSFFKEGRMYKIYSNGRSAQIDPI